MIKWVTKKLGVAACNEVDPLSDIHVLDVRDLLDRNGNLVGTIKKKIDEGVKCLKSGRRLVVCCDLGVSRSKAIAIGVLAKYDRIDFHQAVRRVLDSTGETSIRLEVLSVVRNALNVVDEHSTGKSGRISIIMTGGKGFIGSELRTRLSGRHLVTVPTRPQTDMCCNVVGLDLLAKDVKADVLVHLANPHSYSTNKGMSTSLLMLKNALDVCTENRIKMLYVSCWEIYSGYQSNGFLANESVSPFPGSINGQTKMLGELLVHDHCKSHGVPYLIARPSIVYGKKKGRPNFLWNFFEKSFQNKQIVTHRYQNGRPLLDMIYIDDLVDALVRSIDARLEGSINLGTGTGTSTFELAEIIIESCHSSSTIRELVVDGCYSNVWLDSRVARDLLDWRPIATPEITIKKVVEYATSLLAKREGDNP